MPPTAPTAARVTIVLAIFRPDLGFLAQQIASFARQTLAPERIIAVIADLQSADAAAALFERHALAYELVKPFAQLDSINAFQLGLQEALRLCPADGLIALADQDDIWHDDRLAAGAAALAQTGADLVHSDARLVDAEGKLLHPSMFRFERRLKRAGLHDLLYRNNVTGMTVLCRRDVVARALPFPRQSGVHFYHDLWLALVAEAAGGVHLIRRPLVDYRQHGANAIGAVDRSAPRKRRLSLPDMTWMRREASAYGRARYLAHSLRHRMSQSASGDPEATQALAKKLKPLARYTRRLRGSGSHLADMARYMLTAHLDLARLAFGAALVSAGRSVWIARDAFGRGVNLASTTFDERLYSLSPGLLPEGFTRDDDMAQPTDLMSLIDQRKSPRFAPVFTAPQAAVVILVPTLNPPEIFAGIATALDIGLALAAEGHPVRFIATDLPVSAPAISWQFLVGRLSDAQAASGAAGRITLHCGRTEAEIPAHRGDRFLATAWWSAHIARDLIESHHYLASRFIYLIQDFEPGFYPWGREYADAEASYHFDFIPLFNSSLLRDFFKAQGYGFAREDSLTFRPSIDIARYCATPRPEAPAASPRRIALYGRPEVARNLFGTAIEALDRFLVDNHIAPAEVRIESVGLRHGPVALRGGHVITSRGKLPYDDYPAYLAQTDIGLSLMLSPHPSHPPIEMAAAGARVVTNGFGGKNLSKLSPAILSCPPDAHALAQTLKVAWKLPAPSAADRMIDLGQLGAPLDETVKALAQIVLKQAAPAVLSGQKRRLIVHVGAPKCGSTYLQRVVLQNQERLEAQGILYPPCPGKHPGNGAAIDKLSAAELEDLFGSRFHTAFYSHEDLFTHPDRGKPLAQLARDLDLDLQIVTFLRPLSEVIFGAYSQAMKQDFYRFRDKGCAYGGQDFDGFARAMAPRFHFDVFLRFWRLNLPRATHLVHSSREIRPVMSALFAPTDLDWNVPKHLTNPSLRIEDCEALAREIARAELSPAALEQMWKDAHNLTSQPDRGRTAARAELCEALLATVNEKILAETGYDNRLRDKIPA